MDTDKLIGLDLNLLVVLYEVLRTESITEAAKRLGRSPTAVNHALGMLSKHFDDPMFVRSGVKLTPTAWAEEFMGPLGSALSSLGVLMSAERTWTPQVSRRRFVLEMSDYISALVLPRLVARLRQEAPQLELVVRGISQDWEAALEEGGADLAVAPTSPRDATLWSRNWFQDGFVSVLRQGHPALLGGWSPEKYAMSSHLRVTASGMGDAYVQEAFEREGLRRRVRLTLATLLSVPEVLRNSDLVVTLPRMLTRALDTEGLDARSTPILLDPLQLRLVWHRRWHEDPGHEWLRSMLVESAPLLGIG